MANQLNYKCLMLVQSIAPLPYFNNLMDMTQKLIVIDACMRDGESRTKKILKPIVAELGKRYEVETIVLDGDDYQPGGEKCLPSASVAMCLSRLWSKPSALPPPTAS